MVRLSQGGAYLLGGTEIVEDNNEAAAVLAAKLGSAPDKKEAAHNTIAYNILTSHNTSGNDEKLEIKFDKLTSHDITFVGIIQTARASGLEKFPIPYVLTNCHNSLCAVGGTINEDDHMFGLTCAKKYGGIYVPPHQAVIHQFAREMLAEGGKMILGSDIPVTVHSERWQLVRADLSLLNSSLIKHMTLICRVLWLFILQVHRPRESDLRMLHLPLSVLFLPMDTSRIKSWNLSDLA